MLLAAGMSLKRFICIRHMLDLQLRYTVLYLFVRRLNPLSLFNCFFVKAKQACLTLFKQKYTTGPLLILGVPLLIPVTLNHISNYQNHHPN